MEKTEQAFNGFGGALSGLAELGWVLLAFLVLKFLYDSREFVLESIQKYVKTVRITKEGVTIDLVRQTIREEKQAEQRAALEEARSEETKVIRLNQLVWGTSGRRPGALIEFLEDQGYKVDEFDPIALDVKDLKIDETVAALVTNLKHGSSYTGGLDLVRELKRQGLKIPVVVYTSSTAVDRRANHLQKIKDIDEQDIPVEVATSDKELLNVVEKLSRR